MSETIKTNEQEKPSLLVRVIRATARATADAVYERLCQEKDEGDPGAASPERFEQGQSAGADARGAEEIVHLLRIHDGLSRLLDHYESSIGLSRRRKRRRRPEIRLVLTLIDRVLARLKALGVSPMPFPERIDYRLHEPVRVTATPERQDNGRVVDVFLEGFTCGECVLRQAKVSVLKYVPTAETQPK